MFLVPMLYLVVQIMVLHAGRYVARDRRGHRGGCLGRRGMSWSGRGGSSWYLWCVVLHCSIQLRLLLTPEARWADYLRGLILWVDDGRVLLHVAATTHSSPVLALSKLKVVVDPYPGQEERNASMLLEEGAGAGQRGQCQLSCSRLSSEHS